MLARPPLIFSGFMADLCPNLPQPRPWTLLWEIRSLHPSLQMDSFVARKQKARIGFFQRRSLAKNMNGSMKLFSH